MTISWYWNCSFVQILFGYVKFVQPSNWRFPPFVQCVTLLLLLEFCNWVLMPYQFNTITSFDKIRERLKCNYMYSCMDSWNYNVLLKQNHFYQSKFNSLRTFYVAFLITHNRSYEANFHQGLPRKGSEASFNYLNFETVGDLNFRWS